MSRWVVCLAIGLTTVSRALAAGPISVEASDLTKRADLIGKEVMVDDRFTFFVFHKGKGYDEVVLRRAEGVTFHLAQNLRPAQAPRPGGVRLQGVLQKTAGLLSMEVQAMELLPPDLERLNSGVTAAGPNDFEKRNAWSRWASSRAEAFGDEPLRVRGRELAAEALWIEAGKGSEAERPAKALALAKRGRSENAAEPTPSALAHRAFRARLSSAESVADLDALAREVEAFFTEAKEPRSGGAERMAEKGRDMALFYRDASPEVRRDLDRGLLGDILQAAIERQFADSPAKGLELADRARLSLPDRPGLAEKLKKNGLAAASSNVSRLSLREVELLAARYRDELGQPQESRDLLRKWLDDRRENRLSRTDSDGRIQLALQYDRLLGDRATAVSLLRAALVIDPGSKEIADLFRRFGYRRVDDHWVETTTPKNSQTETGDLAAGGGGESGVNKGMTREQVRTRLGGKPDKVVRVATQGEVLEQWIYQGAKGAQIVNFRRGLDRPEPRVVNFFTLP